MFGLFYVANVVMWSIVFGIVWGLIRVFRGGVERQCVEHELSSGA